jgi:hypothetical protein
MAMRNELLTSPTLAIVKICVDQRHISIKDMCRPWAPNSHPAAPYTCWMINSITHRQHGGHTLADFGHLSLTSAAGSQSRQLVAKFISREVKDPSGAVRKRSHAAHPKVPGIIPGATWHTVTYCDTWHGYKNTRGMLETATETLGRNAYNFIFFVSNVQ